MAKITQNRRIALFSLWSFNQGEAGKKKKRKIVFMIAKTIFSKKMAKLKVTVSRIYSCIFSQSENLFI